MFSRKLGSLALLAAGIIGCQDATSPPNTRPHASQTAAPRHVIPGRYIVVLRGNVADVRGVAQRLTAQHGGTLRRGYTAPLPRLTGSNLSAPPAPAIGADPPPPLPPQNHPRYPVAEQPGATPGP